MADRFFIAPYDEKSGLQTDVKPWLVPDEAFSELENAYVFRGRVRKRFGSRWLGDNSLVSRFRVNVGVIAGGSLAGNIRTILADAGFTPAIGQAFSASNIVFTVWNPAPGAQQMLRTDGSLAPATYNLTDSSFNITATGLPNGTIVYFYPDLPVMGLLSYEQSTINDEFIIGFDTRYAYQYIGGWERLATEATPGAAVWTGNDTQFFWSANWSGLNASDKVFYVTNFNENEPNFMRYFFGGSWNNFRPQIDATPNFLNSARILVVFKNRLVALNTWEGPAAPLPGTNYPNRARFSQVGDPLSATSWRQDLPNKGNAIDASTTEAIITAEFVKDRLIVYFERSTWELVYTSNQAYPFTWQQINTELGAEATNSIIPFDKVCLGVGNVGIHACNGSNVERIDDKIPDEVFEIHNVDGGIERVYGIRDFFVEMVYWSLPDTDATADFPYPSRVLVLNYKTGTWAFNDDSITAFGYFQPTTGVTWDSETVSWDDSEGWDSGSVQSKFRQVIGGNQEGYTFICDAEETTNAAVLQITNLVVPVVAPFNIVTVTAINHNLRKQQYVYFQGITGTGNLTLINNKIFQIISTNFTANTFDFLYKDDANNILEGIYSGGGLISRVSQISITTKEYNFYAKDGRNAYVSKVDFMVDSTATGQIQVDFFVSTADTPLLQDSAGNGVLLGTGTLDTFPYIDTNPLVPAPVQFEKTAIRLWHPVYFQADGEVVQFQLILNDAQMRDVNIREDDFVLHAMCIYAQPTSYRFQ